MKRFGVGSICVHAKHVSVSADGSKGVKHGGAAKGLFQIHCFSIRRWIEGCEAVGNGTHLSDTNIVSVSADGSKGVKHIYSI